jgi:VanZ family protein
MLDKVTAITAWALLALIAFATLSPIQDRPTLATSSSIEHVAAFAVLGVLFCLAYPRQFTLVCLIVIGSAVLLEYAQLLTPDRHGRVDDALEKVAGGAAGIVIGRAVVYFAQKKRFWK